MTTLIAQTVRVKQADGRQQLIASSHLRLMVLMLLFIIANGCIGVRLVVLAIESTNHVQRSAVSAYTPPRADLLDRDGNLLARTINVWSIGVHPSKLLNPPEELAPKLAALMPERTEAEYLALLKSHENFTYLQRRASPDLVAQVNALGEPAMDYVREPQRLYPQTTLAAHVLGYTNIDGHGVTGMERAMDARLSDPNLRSQPLMLSINTRVQGVLESELSAGMVKQRARGAAGLVLDARTGEVLALVSLPVFNPNKSGLPTADDPARFNSVVQGVYELGSTFKPLTFANAIETGTVTSLAKRYDATAPLKVGQFTIHDDEPANRWLNLPEALVHSSNIVTAQIADMLGEQKTRAFFTKLHFDTVPQLELHEKAKPRWPAYWARTSVMTVGYGHGMAVTPLHLATAYAALVNGGIWRPATLLKLDPKQIPVGERVFSASTSMTMRKMLRLVVMEGTGERANVDGMRVGGKTGTAEKAFTVAKTVDPLTGQVISSAHHGYNHHANISTFVSAFPMDDPQYIVLTMLDEPHGSADTGGFSTAGMVSAPIAGKVIARIGPMLGILPDPHKDIDVSELTPLLWKPKAERR